MGLEGLELPCKHFVVCVSADEDYVIEFSEECHFVGVECEPCVHSFLDHSSLRIFTKMFVVEDHVVLNKAVLELSFTIEKVFPLCVLSTVTSSVVVTFCDEDMPSCNTVHRCKLFSDEL